MRGTTLVELLVALCIAALVLAGALSGMARVGSLWQSRQVQARLNERAQYVFASLEPELQMAGFFGRGAAPVWPPGQPLPPAVALCGAPLLTRMPLAIEWLPAPWPLACSASGGGALTGAVLLIRRASARQAQPDPGRIQVALRSSGPATAELRWQRPVPAGIELHDLHVRAYYLARQSDGDPATPALRVKSLSAVAGSPTFIDTEVMPGVEALQATLLPSPEAPRSVRLSLTLRADEADRRGAEVPRLTISRDFALRNAAR